MRVQPIALSPLQALNLVLGSIDAVRNGRAQWLLLVAFAVSGLLLGEVRRALMHESPLWAALAAVAAFVVTFYGSNAAGLMLMDDARGRPARDPRQAVADALARCHRLLLVVLCVLLLFAAIVAAVAGLLWAAQFPRIGPWLLGLTVPLAVPALGLSALVMVGLVGPLAAPAVWCGLSVIDVLRLLRREIGGRLPQVLMLSAAVSLLSAAVAGLVSFVVLAGGRMLVTMAALLANFDLGAPGLMAALFGQGLRAAAGTAAAAPGPYATAAITGGGVVFALGLVLPGVVYLRGLCAVFLAVQPPDDAPPG
ncbi:hypothetical protein [Aquabacterium sp.]|uniref:hypothetical protein n=1 Tax=Aquabacterium sp. TaxID=1872578 RepID=UPI002C5E47B4|nr:hypothetical protein [Aquabacterium sp.]HSW07557.1 hypothetical protein [Aquabacterium sp.]